MGNKLVRGSWGNKLNVAATRSHLSQDHFSDVAKFVNLLGFAYLLKVEPARRTVRCIALQVRTTKMFKAKKKWMFSGNVSTFHAFDLYSSSNIFNSESVYLWLLLCVPLTSVCTFDFCVYLWLLCVPLASLCVPLTSLCVPLTSLCIPLTSVCNFDFFVCTFHFCVYLWLLCVPFTDVHKYS